MTFKVTTDKKLHTSIPGSLADYPTEWTVHDSLRWGISFLGRYLKEINRF